MNYIYKFYLLSILIGAFYPNIAMAGWAEKVQAVIKDGGDKLLEKMDDGFDKLNQGVGKLATPYVQKNNAEYFFQLGQAYYKGSVYFNDKYITQDYGKALEAWESAAYNGDKLAPYNIGLMYYDGQGTPVDRKKACEWFLKGALLDDISAQYNVASCYYNGIGFEKDYSEAFKWFLNAANKGNEKAQYRVAEIYFFGTGTELNLNKAMEWYKKSAAQGNAQAKSRLESLEKAANTPYKSLTIADVSGQVIDGNQLHASAINAAQQGNAQAQFELGMTYFKGIGVQKDYLKALEWFNKAADQGHERAKEYILSTYYAQGSLYFGNDTGVTQDDVEAFKWYSKGANLGHSQSQYMIGLMYYFGEGVAKDEKMGIQWLKKAAALGNKDAQKLIAEYRL